jgi:exoribonuclease R
LLNASTTAGDRRVPDVTVIRLSDLLRAPVVASAGETVGRVTRIITREKMSVVGNVFRAGGKFVVAPDDPRFVQQVLLTPSSVEVTAGDKVVVKLDDWTDRRKPLTGVATTRLGKTHEPRAELLGIYEKFNLATSFPADVEREAEDERRAGRERAAAGARARAGAAAHAPIRQTPRSARTSAPPSSVSSLLSGSRTTAAVRPTPEEPRPVV